jgi:HlyD family secretion protein
VGLLLVLLVGVLHFRYGLTSSLVVEADRLQFAESRRAAFQEYIPVTGNVVPARTVYLDAVEGGQISAVHAEEGQLVVAGQPLLELKNPELQLRLVEAEARLAEQVNNLNVRHLQVEQTHLQLQERLIGIDGQLAVLDADLKRNEQLLAAGTIAAKPVEDMRVEYEALRGVRTTVQKAQQLNRDMQTNQVAQIQSSVDAMSANLRVARENLENLVMRAPIAGRLSVFEADVGEAKGRAQRIGQVDDATRYKVSAQIDEYYLGRVQVGQIARTRIGSTDVELSVTKIYPSVRERLIQIDLGFDSEKVGGLRRGQTLRMKLEIGDKTESLVVQNGPWVEETGGVWAFVVSPDAREARRREITIGRRNPDVVEIAAGLKGGERVIASSYAQFKDFERIEIRGSVAP